MGLLKWLLTFWSVPAAGVQKVNPKQIDFEVPRYPPFMTGLPVVSPEALLQSQRELLDRLALAVNVNKSLYAQHYLSILERFASYVHLLPASQSHHHRGAGGLLRHSIEVALRTVHLADKLIIDLGKTPEQRRTIEPRWQLTAFVAGLCHDLGKPASDMLVSGPDRENVWDPIDESLSEWAIANDVSHYFIDWREGRGKQHLALSTLLATKIIGREALSWISQGSKELVVWLTETLNENPSARNPLCELVKLADQSSVERDLKSMGVAMAGYELGVPVERHLTDIMRRLIKEGTWRINEAGARIFKIEDATFLVWPSAGDEIARQVREDGVPGLPRTADGILDMLTDRDLARMRECAETPEDRFWRIAPEVLSAKVPHISLSCIRLRDDALISTLPLASIPGKVLNGFEDHEQYESPDADSAGALRVPTGGLEGVSPKQAQAAQEVSPQAPVRKSKPVTAPVTVPEEIAQSTSAKVPPKMVVDPASGEILAVEVTKADGSVHTVEMRSGEPKGAGKKSLSSPKGICTKGQTEQERGVVSSPPGEDLALPEGVAHVEAKDAAGSQATIREIDGEPALESAKVTKSKGKTRVDISQPPTMEFDGALGMLLLAIIDDLKAGTKQWNRDVRVDREEMVYLRWPQSFNGYGLTPKTILGEGKSKDWLWIDPCMPMTPVVDAEFEGQLVKAVRLNLEPSYTFLYRSAYGDPQPKAVKTSVEAGAMEARPKESEQVHPQLSASEPSKCGSSYDEPPAYLSEVPLFSPDVSTAEISMSAPYMPASKLGSGAEQKTQVRKAHDVRGPEIPMERTEGRSEVIHTPSESQRRRADSKPRTSLQERSPSSKANESLEGDRKAEDLSKLSRPERFKRFMVVINSMEGSIVEGGWSVLDRKQCLSLCKSKGLQISRQELEIFVSDNKNRLRIDGLSLFYKKR